MKGKMLITTDSWFYAPDGTKYKSVWGEITIHSSSILGIETNRNSTNWYIQVGSDDKGVIIAGCQVHYAVKCPTKPYIDLVMEVQYDTSGNNSFRRPTEIYIAE